MIMTTSSRAKLNENLHIQPESPCYKTKLTNRFLCYIYSQRTCTA